MKKVTLFKIISISFPFFLIVLMEIVLRMSGYGENYQLFHILKNVNKPDYLVMNPDIAKKYFNDKNFHSDCQSDLFLKTKTDNTFRIFVQGESSVVGFPYYYGGSFPRMLKHRLSQTFPEKNIEVVNTGMTAVNSYTLWDLTDEIIKQKPDLVIIYAGHNEYYGALGAGSSISSGSHPSLARTYLFLKNFRFFQLLDNGYIRIFNQNNNNPKSGKASLMEKMAREQNIPYNSKVYYAGLNQFESNLEKILNKYKKNNIPVILSTLVSNEKDIKPFISESINDKNQFTEDLEQKKPEANYLAQKNAMAAYILGHYYLQENLDTARKYLLIAKELDLLRFRAPEKINDVIVDLAKKYEYPLVDMKGIFSSHSPQGVIGDELLLEHVHPNVKGQFLMADAFYNKIKELGLLSNWDNYISFDEAFQDIPISEIDSLKGKLIIDYMRKSWPFDLSMAGKPTYLPTLSGNPTYEQKAALQLCSGTVAWKDLMFQAFQKYDQEGAYEKGLHVAESLVLEFPAQGEMYRYAGTMCVKLNDLKKAAYYILKYNKLEKSSLSARQLATIYIMLNKREDALKTLLDAKNRGINDENLNKLFKETSQMPPK